MPVQLLDHFQYFPLNVYRQLPLLLVHAHFTVELLRGLSQIHRLLFRVAVIFCRFWLLFLSVYLWFWHWLGLLVVLNPAFHLTKHIVVLPVCGLAEHEKGFVFVVCAGAQFRLVFFHKYIVCDNARLHCLSLLTLQIRADKFPKQFFHVLHTIDSVQFR